jgi:hypothetical protein
VVVLCACSQIVHTATSIPSASYPDDQAEAVISNSIRCREVPEAGLQLPEAVRVIYQSKPMPFDRRRSQRPRTHWDVLRQEFAKLRTRTD